MRKLIYCVATSLDGFIADDNGSSEGFPFDEAYLAVLLELFPETLPAPFHPEGSVFENKLFDSVLMGRNTYEIGLNEGVTNPYPTLDQYVFSTTMPERPDGAVTVIANDAIGFVEELKQKDEKDIWLCGGADLAGMLFNANLVDEMIVKLNPVILGSGIPLYRGPVQLTTIELIDSKAYSSGHVLLRYRIDH
jgi:dihydrofolate reductase